MALDSFPSLTKAFGAIAKKILQEIVLLLIGPQEQIRWLTDAVMREYTFATMDDSDDIYCYNNGIFVKLVLITSSITTVKDSKMMGICLIQIKWTQEYKKRHPKK
jgi:hypothetical protein